MNKDEYLYSLDRKLLELKLQKLRLEKVIEDKIKSKCMVVVKPIISL